MHMSYVTKASLKERKQRSTAWNKNYIWVTETTGLHRTCDKEKAKWQRARHLFTLILGCIRPECADKSLKIGNFLGERKHLSSDGSGTVQVDASGKLEKYLDGLNAT